MRTYRSAALEAASPLGYRADVMPRPLGVSFVIATYNRRDVLLETLARLAECGLERDRMEIFVVDNASADGTADAVRQGFPEVTLLALPDNRGSCAKARALPHAKFRYTVTLDDDSWPLGDSVKRMIDRFEREESLGAAGFVAHLPDGGIECSALPGVFIGCGAGFRTDLLQDVGGIDEGFFMQAEEYDLSFRIAAAGYRVETFDDLHVRHLKTPASRYGGTTAYYDTRNNIVVACRYLCGEWLEVYLTDWLQRYAWLSTTSDNTGPFLRGAAAGLWRAARDRLAGRAIPLPPHVFERSFRVHEIRQRMLALRDSGVRRILLGDFGKNVFAFWRGARLAGLEMVAVANDTFGRALARRYRGVPIRPTDEAIRLEYDAIIIANTSYAHAARRTEELAARTERPVHDWFGRWPTLREE